MDPRQYSIIKFGPPTDYEPGSIFHGVRILYGSLNMTSNHYIRVSSQNIIFIIASRTLYFKLVQQMSLV